MVNNKLQWPKPPEMQIDTNKDYKAVLHTEKGDILINLFEKKVPNTVNNFVFLSREGYYDGTIFHRVILNFMGPGWRSDRNRRRRTGV